MSGKQAMRKGQDYTTTISVDQTPEDIFGAINNVRGWWSEEIEGSTNRLGDEWTFHHRDVHRCKMKTTELVPGKKVVWLVLDNYFNFTRDKTEWKGTKIIFEISKNGKKTLVRFTHQGLLPDCECFDVCSDVWDVYIMGSLRSLITAGKGTPNKKEVNAGKTVSAQSRPLKMGRAGKQNQGEIMKHDKTVREVKNHKVVSREEWTAARVALLKEEKELTRRGDEVTRHRRELPWVRIEKEYLLETDAGKVPLAKLFQGRSQLIVYHFMLGPDYQAGCPSCSSIADGFNGFWVHLVNHDVMFWAVSRAPLAKIQSYKRRMGWDFPWASSYGTDFNYDFGVSFTREQQQSGTVQYNFHSMDTGSELGDQQTLQVFGADLATTMQEAPGMSAFALEDGLVYHTYSSYTRGLDSLWGLYQWLDRAPHGRNEAIIRGFGDLRGSNWIRRHDEYEGK
jgi:predicted dithiol-disulfide oxidoreductase (DUF899 family)